MDSEKYFDFEPFAATAFPTIRCNITQDAESNCTTSSPKCKWNTLNTGMTCLLFLTFVLNVLSSVVLFRVPLVTVRGRSNPVYFCIRFLNICDVLQAFFLILMPAFATQECGWLGGQVSCNIMGFIVLFFLLVSPLVTILMAFDRVVALYWPFKYRSHLGLKMLKVLLPSACVLVCIITILPLFGVGRYHVVKGRRFCLLDTITDNSVDRSYVIAVHAIFFVALLFMLSCTIAFQSKLVRMSFTKKHKESKSKARKKLSSRRTRNATLTTMAVCGIFIICYLPYVTRVLVEASTLQKSPTLITWITFGLAFLQPLLNPIVYIGTNARYRQELQALIKNMKVSEWETSSESGVTHHGSRGAFSGFRRKFSSGGNRNSKRGSKRQHRGSHTSLHNSATSPCPSNLIGKGIEKRTSWLLHSKVPNIIPGNCPNENANEISTNVTSVLKTRGDDFCQFREASSSSGVRSYDSVEKVFLTPPILASSLTFKFSSRAIDYETRERTNRVGAHSQGDPRERSSTVSEGENLSPGKQSSSVRGIFSSTPALSVIESPLHFRQRSKEGKTDCISIHDSVPQSHIDSSGDKKTLLNGTELYPKIVHPEQLSVPVEGASVFADHLHSNSLPPNKAHSSIGTKTTENSPQHSRQERLQCRPSYKLALEKAPRYFLSRKPSKRDSGVGDS